MTIFLGLIDFFVDFCGQDRNLVKSLKKGQKSQVVSFLADSPNT